MSNLDTQIEIADRRITTSFMKVIARYIEQRNKHTDSQLLLKDIKIVDERKISRSKKIYELNIKYAESQPEYREWVEHLKLIRNYNGNISVV